MALIAKNTGGGDFEMTPEGNHLAICYRVVDIGFHEESFKGKPIGLRPKVRIFWELCHEFLADGRPFSISTKITSSLGDKANLRHLLESWRGRAFTPEELEGFDITKVLGAPCLLNVIHKTGTNDPSKRFSVVKGAAAIPKGTNVPEIFNPALFFDMDAPNLDVWNLLPEFVQKECRESAHWALTEKLLFGSSSAPGDSVIDEAPPLDYEDIPF